MYILKYSRFLLLIFFILSIAVTVYSYEEVLEDYAVNILTTRGLTAESVSCKSEPGSKVHVCKVKSTTGIFLTVICHDTEVPGNDKYTCSVMSM